MSRKRGLDTATVVGAAVALADREGPQALSLNRLAAELGVRTPSLYNHIDGLPGLHLELARLNALRLSDCLGRAAIGKTRDVALRAIAQTFRDYIKNSPGVYAIATQHKPNAQADPELQRLESEAVEIVLAVIASFGLENQDGLHAVRGLRSLVHGFATLEIAGGFGLPLDLDESFRRLVEVFINGLECAS